MISLTKHPQLERLLNLTLRTMGFEGACIVVQDQVLASSGVFVGRPMLAELGLFDTDYVERGLLEVYGPLPILGQPLEPALTAHQQLCLEDIAVLASELLSLESPQSLEQVYFSSPIAMLILDAHGRVEGCNPVAERLWGCGALELRGRSADELFSSSTELKKELIYSVLAGHVAKDIACSSQTKDGAALQLSVCVTPVQDAGGQTLRLMCAVEEVSERIRSQQKLEGQKRFYESILDHIPAEIAVLDPGLRYLYINAKAIKNPELRAWSIGKQDAEIAARAGWNAESLPQRRTRLEQVVETGERLSWEESFELPTGRVYRQRNANPAFDASGELRFIVGYSADITALKHSEQSQLKAFKEYKSLFEGATIGLYRADAQGRLLAVNPAMVRLSGYATATDYIHAFNEENRSIFVAPSHREQVREALLAGYAVEGWRTEVVAVGQSSRRWVSESARAVLNEGGELLYFEGTVRDVHSEVQALERLKLIERAVESSSDAIALYDAQATPLYQNPAALLSFGYNLDAFLLHHERLLEPEKAQALAKYLETHLTWSGELEIRHAEGRVIPCQVRIDTIMGEPDSSGQIQRLGTLAVVTDISLRREVQRVKDEFITTVSHELRTPLTSLRGALGLLAGNDWGAPNNPEIGNIEMGSAARDLIHIALSNTERLSRRVSDILDIGKLESGEIFVQKGLLELGALLEQAALEQTAVYSGRGVRLALETSTSEAFAELRVQGDAERLLQVMVHLLDNAAKASKRGGLVTARLISQGRAVRLEVTDSGVGIPKEFGSQIFGRFARADTSSARENTGLGLGLAISKAIVERHGGVMGYEQPQQGGSMFFMELPLVNERYPRLEMEGEVLSSEDKADLL